MDVRKEVEKLHADARAGHIVCQGVFSCFVLGFLVRLARRADSLLLEPRGAFVLHLLGDRLRLLQPVLAFDVGDGVAYLACGHQRL